MREAHHGAVEVVEETIVTRTAVVGHETRGLLIALRHVSEAYGMAEVAKAAGIKRESLYRSLSPKGNPTLKTLTAVLKAVGLRLDVAPGSSSPQSACAC